MHCGSQAAQEDCKILAIHLHVQEDFHARRQQGMVADELLLQNAFVLEGAERAGQVVLPVYVPYARPRQVVLDATPEALVDARPRERQAVGVRPELHEGRDDKRQTAQEVRTRNISEHRERDLFFLVEELLPCAPGPHDLHLSAREVPEFSKEVRFGRHEAVRVQHFLAEVPCHPGRFYRVRQREPGRIGLGDEHVRVAQAEPLGEHIRDDQELVAEAALPTVHGPRRAWRVVVASEEPVQSHAVAGLDATEMPKQSGLQRVLHAGRIPAPDYIGLPPMSSAPVSGANQISG